MPPFWNGMNRGLGVAVYRFQFAQDEQVDGFFAHDFCYTSGKAGFAMGRKAQWESAFSYGTSSGKGNSC